MTLSADDKSVQGEVPQDDSSASAVPDAGHKDSEQEWDEEALPEWEPLTPELVEDEAIRGDFMLRWAIVLLAFLLGCAEISDTATLVQIKTGQYIAANGWWPPANDVFSYTAADRPWVNLSWLFDIFLAGIFSIAGDKGLSILTAILAAVTFGLVIHTSLPNTSTWWGSVSASLTLLVCYPQFTARPEMITLLGIGLTLWLLHRWKTTAKACSLWWLVPVFVLWSNLDQRMFLGLAVLVLYAAGELIGSFLGRPGLSNDAHRRQLWKVIAVCFVATMLNPSGWNSLLEPLQLYGVEYPALRNHYAVAPSVEELEFFPMVGPGAGTFWRSSNHHLVAGLLVVAMTVTLLVLNRAKADLGHVLLTLGFTGFALAASHELAAACIVFGVVATLNAQEWYRTNFRQTYSVETAELLFSRGGRAVTVLAFFILAYLAISGRLAGPMSRRIGVGFDHPIQTSIQGLQNVLEDSFDDRPFHFLYSQGDLLIWNDQKVFVDHRVGLYHGNENNNILEMHNNARHALRRKRGGAALTGKPEVWKEIFDRFQVTHVLPRMTGNSPDYITYFDLISLPDWQMSKLDGVTAVFYRTDRTDPEIDQYLKEHKVDAIRDVFQTEANELAPRVDWARPRSFYQKYLSLPKNMDPNPVQEARHHLAQLEQRQIPLTIDQALAYAYLAIRRANEGLVQNPQSAEAYFILGRAYSKLQSLESQFGLSRGIRYHNQVRLLQTLSALNQAATIEPKSVQLQRLLFETYYSTQKIDLALRAMEQYDKLTADRLDFTEKELQEKRQDTQRLNELRNQVQLISQQVEKTLQQNVNLLQLAQEVHTRGFVLMALDILEKDPVLLFNNPAARRFQGILLLEAGRLQEAADVFEELQSVAETSGLQGWRAPAAITRLSNGDYLKATQLWSDEINTVKNSRMDALLSTLPMTSPPLLFVGHWRDVWPGQQIVTVSDALLNLPNEVASLLWNIVVCQMESGQIDDAADTLRTLIEEDPETQLRPLVRVYLRLITGEVLDIDPPSDRIPISIDMFTAEPQNVPK